VAKKNNQEIVKHEEQPMGLMQVPEYLQKAPGEVAAGTEYMERQDVTLPRLGLCQALTPQRQKSNPKYIQGLEEGMYFNTITKEVYGEKVRIVPLLFYKSRILFEDMDKGGGLLCQAPDALMGVGKPGGNCLKCPLAQFGQGGEPPECSIFYNYAALAFSNGRITGIENMIVVSLKSTGLKVARDWNALIRLRRADIFAGVYEFTSTTTRKDPYTWQTPIIQPTGWIDQASLIFAQEAYKAVAELHKQGRLRHDVEDIMEPDPGTGTGEM
jgi:hypothetical protein